MNIITHILHQFLAVCSQNRTVWWKMHHCCPRESRKSTHITQQTVVQVRIWTQSLLALLSSNHFTAFKTSSLWAEEKEKVNVTSDIWNKINSNYFINFWCSTGVPLYCHWWRNNRVKKQTSSKGGLCAEQCVSFCFANGSYGNLRTLTYAVIASREHQSK